jgi:hypothetical protein
MMRDWSLWTHSYWRAAGLLLLLLLQLRLWLVRWVVVVVVWRRVA